MKRLFGLIGFTLLIVLAAVYYFEYNEVLLVVLGCLCGAFLTAGVVLILMRKQNAKYAYAGVSLIVVAAAALGACVYSVLYTSLTYLPVVNNYSDKEITITGYVSDEVINTDEKSTFTVKTYTINGAEVDVKIQVNSYYDVGVEAFDKVNMTLTVHKSSSNSLISKGIFLRTYTSETLDVEQTGEKQDSLYSHAVALRLKMKSALDSLLPETYSTLCRAALLGDMQALDNEVYNDFNITGTSFLIVVSGMHLVIIISLLLFFVRKITRNRYIIFAVSAAAVVVFSALTGFTPSIVRAAVMMLVTVSASAGLRKADSLNSLGLSAVILTLANPYSVADVGMLLSFAATAGIILWSKPIETSALRLLRLSNNYEPGKGIKGKILRATRKFAIGSVTSVSVSLSAFLWVLPITVVAFNTVSPLQIFISLLADPVVNGLIVFSLLASVFYLLPFVSFLAYPFALFAGLLCRLAVWYMSMCADLPFASVPASETYYVVWVVFSVLAAVVGCFVKKRRFYVKAVVAASLCVLVSGAALTEILSGNSAYLEIYGVNGGASIALKTYGGTSFLSCGGSKYSVYDVMNEVSKYTSKIDVLIAPGTKAKYSGMQPDFIENFEIGGILIYDSDAQKQQIITDYDGEARQTFGNQSFTLGLSGGVTDEVYCADGVVYQYVSGGDVTVLHAAGRADFSKLPGKYRNPDFLIIDLYPDNAGLVTCGTLIFTGSLSTFERNLAKLEGMCSNVYSVCSASAELNLNDGSYIKISDGG